MLYLLDTNVAWRRFETTDPKHSIIKSTIDSILSRGETCYVTAQILVEFRAIATRPIATNGRGMTPTMASTLATKIESSFAFLPDCPSIYPQWKLLVDKYSVSGKQVHDARLVAVMLVYGVTHLLTLNAKDFQRFAEITVVSP